MTIESAAKEALQSVPGVDGAFLVGSGDERTIFVIAREHGIIDRGALLDIEDNLTKQFGYVELSVRAHQGRGLDSWKGFKQIV